MSTELPTTQRASDAEILDTGIQEYGLEAYIDKLFTSHIGIVSIRTLYIT